MRLATFIALIVQIAMTGFGEMAAAQTSSPAITVIDDGSAGGSVELPPRRELKVELSANPTTGYTWRLELGNVATLRLKSRAYQPGAPPGARLGRGGIDRFVLEALAPGTDRLHFEYRRGSAAEPARSYDLKVTVTP